MVIIKATGKQQATYLLLLLRILAITFFRVFFLVRVTFHFLNLLVFLLSGYEALDIALEGAV